MGKSPAFQFYPADYLADERVQAMSIEGEGCYTRLMSYCWREGSIPSDRASLVKLCKGYDGPGIDEAKAMFVRSSVRGRLTHKRLDAERDKQESHSKRMQDAGLEGARRRWLGHSQAMPTPMASDGSLSSSSSSDFIIPPIVPQRGTRKSKRYWDARVGTQEYIDHVKGKAQ